MGGLEVVQEQRGSELRVSYGDGIRVIFGRIVRDKRDGPKSPITVECSVKLAPDLRKLDSGNVRAYKDRVTLESQRSRNGVAKACAERVPGIHDRTWATIIEDACDRVMDTVKGRVSPVMLGNNPPSLERPKFQVSPLLPSRQPTLLWGNSDIGKSWVAVYLAACVENRVTHNGLTADLGRVMFVDYETTAEAIEERVRAVRAGLGDLVADDWELRYETATSPLVDLVDELGRYVSDEKIDLVIIDSLGLALGGIVNESENVVQLFQALRELDCTTLLIDHQGKGEDAKERGAIGSSYKRHYSRSEWEMRRSEDGDNFNVGLYCRKANGSRKPPPIGLALSRSRRTTKGWRPRRHSPDATCETMRSLLRACRSEFA